MKFKPLLPDFGITAEIECRWCGKWVSNVDRDTRRCFPCFKEENEGPDLLERVVQYLKNFLTA